MNRNKEDVKHERIVRGLSRLDDNRKCLNCGSLGPQYVCTTFSTFVCMPCGGVHREFNHRVKSISLSKFTPEEVAALQSGGNKRALEMYFKHWDSKRLPVPASSNPDKLRDFVKAVYVDQLYAANKPPPPPPAADENQLPRGRLRPGSLTSHSFEERRSGIQREAHQRTRSDDRPTSSSSPSSSSRDYKSGFSPPVRSMREIIGDDLPALRIEPQGTPPSNAIDSTVSSTMSGSGTFVGVAPVFSQPSSATEVIPYPESTGMVEQPYVKADTAGWATFDSSPEQAASSAQWQGIWHDPNQGTMWSNAAQGGGVFSQYTPQSFQPMPRRTSINPFDLPEEDPSPIQNFAPAQDLHPLQNQTSFSGSSTFEAQAWQPFPETSSSSSFVDDVTYTSRPGNPFA